MSEENEEDMNDIQRMQKAEQGLAFIADHFPRLWWMMFNKLVREGFGRDEAIELMKAYIGASCGR